MLFRDPTNEDEIYKAPIYDVQDGTYGEIGKLSFWFEPLLKSQNAEVVTMRDSWV